MRTVLFVILITAQKSLFAQWTTQNSGTSAFLTNVFFPTADTGYITTDNGAIRKTINGGNNWSQVSPANTAYNIYFTSADTGIGIVDGDIKKTTNGGISWSQKFSDGTIFFGSLFFINNQIGYAIAKGNSSPYPCFCYKTTDSGENWTLQSSFVFNGVTPPPSVYFTNANTGFFVSFSEIYKTVDGGINWAFQNIDSTGLTELFSINFPSQNVGYAAGFSYDFGAVVYRTTDAGQTWAKTNFQESNPLYSVFFLTKNVGFVVGGDGLNSGSVYKTNDAGNSWFQSSSQIQTFNSVYFPDDTTGYAVGTNGSVIKYYNPDSVPDDSSHSNAVIRRYIYTNKINVFPNPSNSGIFRISANNKEGNIIVTDMLGQTLYQQISNSNNQLIDISAYPRGIYFAKMQNREGISVFKLIFQ